MFYSICNIKHKIWYSRYQILVNGSNKLWSVPDWTLCVIKLGTEISRIIESQISVHLSNLSDEDENNKYFSWNNIFLHIIHTLYLDQRVGKKTDPSFELVCQCFQTWLPGWLLSPKPILGQPKKQWYFYNCY